MGNVKQVICKSNLKTGSQKVSLLVSTWSLWISLGRLFGRILKGLSGTQGCSQCHWDSSGQTEAFAEVKIVEKLRLAASWLVRSKVRWSEACVRCFLCGKDKGPFQSGDRESMGCFYSSSLFHPRWPMTMMGGYTVAVKRVENWGAPHSWPSGQSLTWSRAVFATSQAWWSYQETNWTQV